MLTEKPEDREDPDDSCSIDQWKCANGQCINKDFLCDKTTDCYDGSDEEEELCNTPDRK